MAPFDFDVEFRAADLDRTVSYFCLSITASISASCLPARVLLTDVDAWPYPMEIGARHCRAPT
jgi:phage-related protein